MSGHGGPTYRMGVIGFAHMHVNELVDRFLATGRVRLVACADTVPRTPSLAQVDGSRHANLRRALAQPDQPRLHADYAELLREEALDLVVFCPEIADHAEVAEAIAARALPMVTEKPLAGSLADARRILGAAKAAGVPIAVNWPMTWRPAIRQVKALLDAGEIGEVWEFKWRNGASLGPLAEGSLHPGGTVVSGSLSEAERAAEWWHQSEAGGGALLDYCCYGACLAAWYLGLSPLSVQGLTANLHSGFAGAEDNAALLLRFPNAIGLIEASWTTFHAGVATGPILYGTRGTIVVDGARVHLYKERGATTPTRVFDGEALPPGRATIAEEFLAHLETGAALHPTLAPPLNLATVAILDAGIRSAASGCAEAVELTGR